MDARGMMCKMYGMIQELGRRCRDVVGAVRNDSQTSRREC